MGTKTLPLEVDLPGRVRNIRLAPSNALYALFEAVVNSIHAVLDGPEVKSGKISIRILRGETQGQKQLDGKSEPGPVIGFQIEDNGIGFDEAHFASFRLSDNTSKAKYGGKGVGRLLWLKVFAEIFISSVFSDGKKRFKRTFGFSSSGIENHTLKETSDKCGTVVTLTSPNHNYRASLQHEPETFAVSIIEHCLEYFIAKVKTLVELLDEFSAYAQELGKLFRDDLKSEIRRDDFSINGSKFTITHLLVRGRKNSRHALHLCANFRRVKDEPLSGRIPGLSGGLRLPNSDEDLAYQGYVSGKLLDELVDAERSSFDFDGLFAYDEDKPAQKIIRSDELLAHAIQKARAFLQPTLEPILEANEARIRNRIEQSLPQYRHLLKFKAEEVKSIPPGVDGHELDTALYRIEQQLDAEGREAMARELSGVTDPDETVDERKQRLEALLDQLNESGKSKLARHVAYRRAVIEWMEDQIVLQPGGKYSLEEAVHAAVCPRSVSSDDVPQSSVNLWLLDDRLYFHYYLASDMRFKDMKSQISKDSADRPDLAIFNRPLSFSDSTDEIGSVILVEFKRPARNDYKQGEIERDPDAQVIDYAETLQAGRGIDNKGGVIHIKQGTPFYAYIIADLTPSLKSLAKRAMFKVTPDGDGYFKFHDNYNMYIELISFKKMIRDAKKRNAAFFHQLGIPMPAK
ncbi:MAG: ATP-binding protein [Pirellulales bacterium]